MKRITLLFFITLLVFVSCNDGPVGIFASIASESLVQYEGTDTFRKATPSDIVIRDQTLYAVLTKLWKKNGAKWEKVTILPSGAFYASSAAVTGTTLYVSFFNSDAASLGVFSTSDDTNWTRTDAAFPPAGEQIQKLETANNVLFAVTSKTVDEKTVYTLYEYNSGSFHSRKTNAADDADEIGMFHITHDGSDFYVASGKKVWVTDLTTFTDSLTLTEDSITSIAFINSHVTLTSAFGKLHWLDGTWKSTAAFEKTSKKLYLSGMVLTGTNKLLVATNSVVRTTTDGTTITKEISPLAGYIEIDVAGNLSETSVATDSNLLTTSNATNFTSTVGDNALSAFTLMTVNGNPVLYAGAVANGLWSNTYTGGAWSGWQRETD